MGVLDVAQSREVENSAFTSEKRSEQIRISFSINLFKIIVKKISRLFSLCGGLKAGHIGMLGELKGGRSQHLTLSREACQMLRPDPSRFFLHSFGQIE